MFNSRKTAIKLAKRRNKLIKIIKMTKTNNGLISRKTVPLNDYRHLICTQEYFFKSNIIQLFPLG